LLGSARLGVLGCLFGRCGGLGRLLGSCLWGGLVGISLFSGSLFCHPICRIGSLLGGLVICLLGHLGSLVARGLGGILGCLLGCCVCLRWGGSALIGGLGRLGRISCLGTIGLGCIGLLVSSHFGCHSLC